MTKKKTSTPTGAANTDVDDFLNDEAHIVSTEDIEITEDMDLSQIPPPLELPDPATVLKTNKAAEGVKLKGTKKEFQFSRFGSNKRPITTDLSDSMLPPITKKHTAIYQLIGVEEGSKSFDSRIEIRHSDKGGVVDTSDFELSPTYSIFDPFEHDFGRQTKVVTYYNGVQRVNYKDPITGEQRAEVRQKLGVPLFSRGQAVIDIMKNYHQYLWWELHPRNKSNRFRDKSKQPLFERIDLRTYNPHVQTIKTENKLTAMNYVRRLIPSQAVDLATALNIPTYGQQPTEIKQALYVKAETDPESVLFKSPDKYMSTTITVMRAMDLGIIDFDSLRRAFFFAQDVVNPMYQVPLDMDSVDSFAKFLVETQEGVEIKEKLNEFIFYWYNDEVA